MSNIFYRICDALPFYAELKKAVIAKHTPVCVTGVYNIHKAQTAMALSELGKLCLICDDEPAARRTAADINELAQQDIARCYPAKELSFAQFEGISHEYEHERLSALSAIASGRCRIIVASMEAAMQACIPPSALKKYSFSVNRGDTVDIAQLCARLVSSGYSRCEQIEGAAQFCVRGGIIDIFPVNFSQPVRIELWGDECDSISLFDIQTQRRGEKISSVTVAPAAEVLFGSEEELADVLENTAKLVKGKNKELAKKHIYDDAQLVKGGARLSCCDKYYILAYSKAYCITDYFEDGMVAFSELANCRARAKGVTEQLKEDIRRLYEDGFMCKELGEFWFEPSDIIHRAEDKRLIFLDTFMRGHTETPIKKLINASCFQSSGWGGDLKHLTEELKSLTKQNYCCIVFGGSEKTAGIIASDLREQGLKASLLDDRSEIAAGMVYVRAGSVSGGFEYPDIKVALLTQVKALRTKAKAPKKLSKDKGGITSLSDIQPGDLVVHNIHGIGRFSGITKMENGGVVKDYITIKYQGSDVLYVPVTQLDFVSRYIGGDEDSVKINKLGSSEWKKTKARAKKAIEDMADELIQLYAKRQMAEGFAFTGDNDWQRDFEERFDYQETDDQLRSIAEIKADMEKPYPMDRLLCGDVGFGKTEVALRAAFKCVLDSKQCAVLVPTTVLAWQHYQTAIRRFEHFPITIELLSRFRTPKQQQEIIKKLRRGDIDIIIGTHRLVQKDVEFKDLGLAIIDEEQRFGVRQKERFKELFSSVDILTLSATPIPRTLNMAMSGIRDMSVIEEPPQDRYPVQTYVTEYSEAIIAQACAKEIRRGGQVYYIHNRVDTIYRCAEKLSELLPEARIAVAHGQLDERSLSEIWRQLIDYEIDILVCTTIIETGVDVANVNTLIIEDADRLGLSQLYQLRGRVGRSNRRAFAYFTFRRGKELSEVATRRLDAIREFTQFGSGFRVAVRDLEIRGAGSVLSGKQHGHMEAIGYDMYIKLLNEAIANAKGEPLPASEESCSIDVSVNAFIPEDYIESPAQRIDAYRRIAGIRSEEDSEDVIDEFEDRYGKLPPSVTGLIKVALIRNVSSQLGITEITQRGERVYFYIGSPEIEQIMALSEAYGKRISFEQEGRPNFSVSMVEQPPAVNVRSKQNKLYKSDKKEKPLELIGNVVRIMTENAAAKG